MGSSEYCFMLVPLIKLKLGIVHLVSLVNQTTPFAALDVLHH